LRKQPAGSRLAELAKSRGGRRSGDLHAVSYRRNRPRWNRLGGRRARRRCALGLGLIWMGRWRREGLIRRGRLRWVRTTEEVLAAVVAVAKASAINPGIAQNWRRNETDRRSEIGEGEHQGDDRGRNELSQRLNAHTLPFARPAPLSALRPERNTKRVMPSRSGPVQVGATGTSRRRRPPRRWSRPRYRGRACRRCSARPRPGWAPSRQPSS
jgi:hypothetical protein